MGYLSCVCFRERRTVSLFGMVGATAGQAGGRMVMEMEME